MLEEILTIHQSGQLDEAEQRYREWLVRNPDDPEALHRLAILRRQQSDLDEARLLARKAADLAPGRDDMQLTLAGLHVQARDFDAAAISFEKAQRINPNQPGAALGLLQVALWRGDLERAQIALDRAERLIPEHPEVLYQKASLVQARGDHQRAVSLFIDMTRRNLGNPAMQVKLAHSFTMLGQHAFAEQALRNAVAMKADYVAARVALAQLLLRQNRPADALPELEATLQIQPDHPLALAGRGDVRRLEGNLPGALADYRKAHERAPDHASIIVSLILTLAGTGEGGQARELLDRSLQRLPAEPELRRLQLRLLHQDSTAYLAACRDWLAVAASDPEPARHLATRLELMGEFGQADAVATEALAHNSRAAYARLLLARSALREGDPERAQEQINRLPEAGLDNVARVERHQLRGITRDLLDDHAGAVDAWLANHRLQAGLAKPIPPPAVDTITPPTAAEQADHSEPTFLLALPGAGSEGVAALLDRGGMTVLNDRFGRQPRPDAIATGEFVALSRRAASDPAAIADFRERYLAGLGAIGQAIAPTLVDWLPFIDLRYLSLIAAAFPRARYLLVERDPRDALLGWLSHGTVQAVAVPAEQTAAGTWLAALKAHLDAALERIPAECVLRIQASELGQPSDLATRIAGFLGGVTLDIAADADFQRARGGLPTALPDGRWQAYADVLADAFAPLQ